MLNQPIDLNPVLTEQQKVVQQIANDRLEMEIGHFISQWAPAKETLMYGMCYWFALVLFARFDRYVADIVYNPVQNHFACQINGKVYDASGQISDTGFAFWAEYSQRDPLHTERIIHDCIEKAL